MSEGGKWGGKQMELGEEDDSVGRSTVDCLRGRLLAERLASRNAKDEAQHLENQLMGLEKMVKEEVKSRNRAEKRLRLLLKKLNSINIGFRGKTDISSASASRTTSVAGDPHDGNSSEISGSQGQNGNFIEHENVEQDSVIENFLFSEGDDANSEKSSPQGSDQSDICYSRFRFPKEEYGLIKGDVRVDDKGRAYDSMALVATDKVPQENWSIDPEVLDSAVKEVLDALKLAKERLQSSMEKRRLELVSYKRVGSKTRASDQLNSCVIEA